MEIIPREQLQTIASALGRAYLDITNKIGDTNKLPMAKWKLEIAFAKLRNSTLFHDDDTSSIVIPNNTYIGFQSYASLRFNTLDNIGYGVQGENFEIGIATQSSWYSPSPTPNWNPSIYGPPSPQGWFDTNENWYSTWKGNTLIDPTQPIKRAWQSFPYEPVGVNTTIGYRNDLLYPSRWNGISYDQIPLWKSTRWISFFNNSYSPDATKSVEYILTQDQLEGIEAIDPLTGMPLDLAVCTHPDLVQAYTAGSWQPITRSLDPSQTFGYLAYNLTPYLNNSWLLTINIPDSINLYLGTSVSMGSTYWADQTWWHVALYWGSYDDLALGIATSSRNTYTSLTNLTPQTLTWQRKNFFDKDLVDRLIYEKTGIQNTNAYLIAQNRYHFVLHDGQYSEDIPPIKYTLPDSWSIAGWPVPNNIFDEISSIDPNTQNVIPVILCCRTSGVLYNSHIDTLIVIGPQITPEFYPNDWNNCTYFPPIPFGYVEIARCILRRSSGKHYDIPSYGYSFDIMDTTFNKITGVKLDVIWFLQTANNFAIPPICDENLAVEILPKLGNFTRRYRNLNPQKPIVDAAFTLIGRASGLPVSVAANRGVLADPTQRPSQIFRGNLKKPISPQLQGIPDAIPFDKGARRVIEDLSGLPPSTEILKLNINNFYLTKETLNIQNQFEIYQEVFGACSYVDPNAKGTRVGKDYCFRMELIDSNENSFFKDWFVLASNFLLTDEEKSYKALTGESTSEYYTQENYQSLSDWHKQGYAALVPDLTMGKAITMFNQVVSPSVDENGNPVVTEEVFRQRLKNQGYTEQQINDAVIQYVEENGPFPIIDTRAYPNLFTSINNASMSITEYTNTSVPYWSSNIASYFIRPRGINDGIPSIPTTNLYSDSFTLATPNLAAGVLETFDATAEATYKVSATGSPINFAEQYRAFRLLDQPSTLLSSPNMSTLSIRMRYSPYTAYIGIGTSDYAIDTSNYYAVNITPTSDIVLGGITLQMKFSGLGVLNINEYIGAELYSSIGTSIGQKLATGSVIRYGEISDTYNEYIFGFTFDTPSNQTLYANTNYWFILKQTTNPTAPYNLEINRLGYTTSGSYLGITTSINYTFSSYDTFQTWYKLLPSYTATVDPQITLSLWTEIGTGNTTLPNFSIVSSPTIISASQLASDFQEYQFELPYNLSGYDLDNTTRLWAVLEKNNEPTTGIIQLDAGIDIGIRTSNTYKLSSNVTTNYKTPVSVASTSINFTYSYDDITQKLSIGTSPIYIDGVALATGYRVLIKDFTNLYLNGIYVLTSDQLLTRDTDFNSNTVVSYGQLIKATGGTINKNKTFRVISPNPIMIGNTTGSGDVFFQEFIDNTWMYDINNTDKKVWYTIYGAAAEVVGAFNRQDYAILQQLPPPNDYRHKMNDTMVVDGFWNFTLHKFDTPQELKIYPRAIWNYTSANPPTVFKAQVQSATTAGIATYSFDTSTNIMLTNGAIDTVDGVPLQTSDRILLKNMAATRLNGIYNIVGVGTTTTILQRSDDFNTTTDIINGAVVGVQSGITNYGTEWIITSFDPHIVNSSSIAFSAYTSQWTYVPPTRDMHVIVRTITGNEIINRYVLVPAGNTTVLDVTGGVPVDGIIWMAIGKGDDLVATKMATTDINDIQLVGFSSNTIEHANIPLTIDGVTLIHNDRVLVKNYPTTGIGTTDPKYNGIYRYVDPIIEYTDTADRIANNYKRFQRTTDFNQTEQVIAGQTIRVMQGSTQANTFWGLNVGTYDPQDIILNVTALNFTQIQPIESPYISAPWYGGSPTDNLVIRSA